MKKLFLTLCIIVSFFLLLRPLLSSGFPETHDGVNHLARIANYYLAVRQGQFPPRLAPTFWGGYGYPVFNYNYPLLNILALPFFILHLPTEFVMKILLITSLSFGVYGFYRLMHSFFHKEASLFATLVYTTAPFIVTNIYVRGSFGEVMAYSLLPHVCLSMYFMVRALTLKRAVYAYASTLMLLLSHNIFAMYFVPLSGVFFLFLLFKEKKHIKDMLLRFFPYVAAGFSSLFFWLPAMLEQDQVTLKLVDLTSFYSKHFPTISELLFSPFERGFSYPGPVDSMSFRIGIISIAVLFFSLMYIFAGHKKKRLLIVFFSLSLLWIILMQPISKPIWEFVSVMHFTQFPWRLTALVALTVSVLAAALYQHAHTKVQWTLIVLCFVMCALVIKGLPISYIHHEDNYYKTFPESSTVQHENKPATLTKIPGQMSESKPLFDGILLETKLWNGSHHVYTVEVDKQTHITEPTAYFPGWETYVDGQKVESEYWMQEGLIAFTVPSGKHTIETVFTQNTPARLVGNRLSAFGFLMFCIGLYIFRRKHIYA